MSTGRSLPPLRRSRRDSRGVSCRSAALSSRRSSAARGCSRGRYGRSGEDSPRAGAGRVPPRRRTRWRGSHPAVAAYRCRARPDAVAVVLDVRVLPGQRLVDGAIESAVSRSLLLVVEYREHPLAATAELVDSSLRSAPELTILATSREPLRVRGEVESGFCRSTSLIPSTSSSRANSSSTRRSDCSSSGPMPQRLDRPSTATTPLMLPASAPCVRHPLIRIGEANATSECRQRLGRPDELLQQIQVHERDQRQCQRQHNQLLSTSNEESCQEPGQRSSPPLSRSTTAR